MRNLSLTMLTLLLFIGCSNQKAKEVTTAEGNGKGVLTEKFEDETFSIMLPKGWVSYRVDYDPKSEGIEKAFKDHNAEGYTLELWSPKKSLGVLLVKSSYGWVVPNASPHQWCQQSQYHRAQKEDCIWMSEITDSLFIDGFPTSAISFAYFNGKDTIIQEMYAIVPKPAELYYTNLKYSYRDEKAHRLGWEILNTLHIKTKKEQ